MNGTPPFEKKQVCREYVLAQGDANLSLSSHTHKRGEQVVDRTPRVTITRPRQDARFKPGDTFTLSLDLRNFTLMPSEGHNQDDGGDHSAVNSGHYHVYLDTEDDAAPHVTDWSPIIDYTLPLDIVPGEHILRVNLRAPDHHSLGVEARVVILVEE